MDGSETPHDELGGFDFLGDIDPVLWDELNSGHEPGSSDTTFFEAALALRCLDATHHADCTRCSACPPPDMAHKYELLGEDGKKNGLKRLRSLLTRTPEWCSSDARDAAAAALQSMSPRAAEALRTRHSSLISKELAFTVLGYWNYKSDVWQKRGNRVVQTHGKVAAAATSAQPPSSVGETREAAVAGLWLMLGTQLRPLSLKATRALAGANACAHAKRDDAAARLYVGELPMVHQLRAILVGSMLPVLANWLAEARTAEEHHSSAALPVPSAPGSVLLAAMQTAPLRVESLLSAGAAYFTNPERAHVFQLHAGMSEAVAVWHTEWAESQRTSILLCSKLADILGQSRTHSPALYAAAAAIVCEFLTAHFAAIAGALTQRITWLRAAATALGLPTCEEFNCPADPLSCDAVKTPMARELPAFVYCPTLGLTFMYNSVPANDMNRRCTIAEH